MPHSDEKKSSAQGITACFFIRSESHTTTSSQHHASRARFTTSLWRPPNQVCFVMTAPSIPCNIVLENKTTPIPLPSPSPFSPHPTNTLHLLVHVESNLCYQYLKNLLLHSILYDFMKERREEIGEVTWLIWLRARLFTRFFISQ